MIVDTVDPRDIQWEVDHPTYRVHLWHQPAAAAGVAPEQVMWHCDEYRVQGASGVDEVLAWARETARPDQSVVLYAEGTDRGRTGLVRLLGVDPTQET